MQTCRSAGLFFCFAGWKAGGFQSPALDFLLDYTVHERIPFRHFDRSICTCSNLSSRQHSIDQHILRKSFLKFS
jgi:hypothetical protein